MHASIDLYYSLLVLQFSKNHRKNFKYMSKLLLNYTQLEKRIILIYNPLTSK